MFDGRDGANASRLPQPSLSSSCSFSVQCTKEVAIEPSPLPVPHAMLPPRTPPTANTPGNSFRAKIRSSGKRPDYMTGIAEISSSSGPPPAMRGAAPFDLFVHWARRNCTLATFRRTISAPRSRELPDSSDGQLWEILLVPSQVDDFVTDLIGPSHVVIPNCSQMTRIRHCRSSTQHELSIGSSFSTFEEKLGCSSATLLDSEEICLMAATSVR
jgi:hypothetical protein